MIQFPLFVFRNKIYMYIKTKKIQELQVTSTRYMPGPFYMPVTIIHGTEAGVVNTPSAEDKSEVWSSQLSNLTSALRFGLIQQDQSEMVVPSHSSSGFCHLPAYGSALHHYRLRPLSLWASVPSHLHTRSLWGFKKFLDFINSQEVTNPKMQS